MPIYEYVCKECGNGFETLVRDSAQPECPKCQGTDLEKQFSTFAAGASETSHPGAALPDCPSCGIPGGPCGLN